MRGSDGYRGVVGDISDGKARIRIASDSNHFEEITVNEEHLPPAAERPGVVVHVRLIAGEVVDITPVLDEL